MSKSYNIKKRRKLVNFYKILYNNINDDLTANSTSILLTKKKSFPINRNKLLFSRVDTDNLHEIKNSSKNKKNF